MSSHKRSEGPGCYNLCPLNGKTGEVHKSVYIYSRGAVDKIVEVAKDNLCILFTLHEIHVHAWSLEIEISILGHNCFKKE